MDQTIYNALPASNRYERRGDKQKIAEAFRVRADLDEVDFGRDFDCATADSAGLSIKTRKANALWVL
jgi:hypothetical protein